MIGNMYSNNDSSLNKLIVNQYDMHLEAHQQKIQNALQWQSIPPVSRAVQQPKISLSLKAAWTTLIHLVVGH